MWKGALNDSTSIGIGFETLTATTTGGIRNTVYGYLAGKFITTGVSNTIFGFAAGANSLTTGNYNTYFGTQCGQLASGEGNLGFGYTSHYYFTNTSAVYNCALGYQAMRGKSSTAASNTAAYNVGLGYQTLYDITTGTDNVAIGRTSEYSINAGSYNVTIGYRTGYNNISGNNNVFIGKDAGYSVASSNNVIIGNYTGTSGLASTVVLADGAGSIQFFATGQKVSLSGSLAVGAVGVSATVGRIDASNDIVAYSTSDVRLKENIQPIENALYKVNQLSGNTFDWKSNPELTILHGFKGKDVGVVAQEVEAILPEVVTTRDSGYKAVKYEKLVPLLIEAIKELTDKVNKLENK